MASGEKDGKRWFAAADTNGGLHDADRKLTLRFICVIEIMISVS